MANVASKIKALNFPEETRATIEKFIFSLSDECVTLEELVRSVNYLYGKGIILKPSQIKVLANDFSYIEKMVDEMDSLGELEAYVEDPNRINCKSAINRLKYLKSIHAEYKKDGKYAKALFSKRAFRAQYGEIDFEALGLDNLDLGSTYQNNGTSYDNVDFTAYQKEEVSPLAFRDKKEDTIIIPPVWPELDTTVTDVYGETSATVAEITPEISEEYTGDYTYTDAGYEEEIAPNYAQEPGDEYASIPMIGEDALRNPQIEYDLTSDYQNDYYAELDEGQAEKDAEKQSVLGAKTDDSFSNDYDNVINLSDYMDPIYNSTSEKDGISYDNPAAEDSELAELKAAFNDVSLVEEEAPEDLEPRTKMDLTNSVVSIDFSNPYEEILSKPQTIGLNDETFDRYEKLADSIRHVLVSVYNIDEVNDTITDNLIKLITNGVENDNEVIYYAITYGKMISEEEAQRLRNAIEEELEYTSILDINLGEAA